MIGIGPPASFFAAVGLITLATVVLVGAVAEPPPAKPVPGRATALAIAWAVGFLAGAVVLSVLGGDVHFVGLLFADGELAAAVAVWFLRAGRTSDDGGGFGRGGDGRGHPSPGGLPEEYWRRWEEELAVPEGELTAVGPPLP